MLPIISLTPQAPGRPTTQTNPFVKKTLTEKLLPELAGIVDDYYADDFDTELAGQPILFGVDKTVLNPVVRENCKRILRSAFCPPGIKEQVLGVMMSTSTDGLCRMVSEFETIADEIVTEGGHLELEDVHLAGMYLRMNCQGANLRGLTVRDHSTISCNMTDADMTGAKFSDCAFICAKLTGVKSAGLLIEKSRFIYTEVTDTHIVDPVVLKCRLPATDDKLWCYEVQANLEQVISTECERFFLHGTMAAPLASPRVNPASCLLM